MDIPADLFVEAISNGGIYFGPSVIKDDQGDHCGYRDDAERVVALNPQAPREQVVADIVDHLLALARPNGRTPERPPPNECRLSLVHSVQHPEEGDEPEASGPREAG